MPSFQKLVDDRSSTNPREFFDKGRAVDPSAATLAGGAPPKAKALPTARQPASQAAPTPSVTPTLATQNAAKAPPSASPGTSKATPAATPFDASGAPGAAAARPVPKKYQEERAARDAMKQKVDIIQLNLVMSMLGAQGNQDNDKSKWKIPGVGNITVNHQKWWNLESEIGGHGAVNLVMHAQGSQYRDAITWLATTFGESIDSDDIKASMDSMKPSGKKHFDPPAKVDKYISFVKHYLKFSRKIPEHIIDSLVAQGRIYADESKNCVFASDGIAEIRSSFDGAGSVKKLVTGSTRKKGFLALPDPVANEKTLAICESAIDAMSYRALNPGRAAISSAGANRAFPRGIAEEAVENGFKVVAAFDADKAGDKASQALFNHFYLKLWLKHKGQSELGKDFDDETLFSLLDANTVTFQLATHPNEPDDVDGFEPTQLVANQAAPASPLDLSQAEDTRNILFFNKNDPFEDSSSPPIILVSIKKNEHGLPQCIDFPIEVSPKGFEFITTKLGVTRDRPKGEKDWNELLKKTVDAPIPDAKNPSPT